MDATAMISGTVIYDVDLAQMDDRPWRKPGADTTDYFNYGFTEGLDWNRNDDFMCNYFVWVICF